MRYAHGVGYVKKSRKQYIAKYVIHAQAPISPNMKYEYSIFILFLLLGFCLSPKLLSPLSFFCYKFFGPPAFWSPQMSLVLIPCQPRYSISRTGPAHGVINVDWSNELE